MEMSHKLALYEAVSSWEQKNASRARAIALLTVNLLKSFNRRNVETLSLSLCSQKVVIQLSIKTRVLKGLIKRSLKMSRMKLTKVRRNSRG